MEDVTIEDDFQSNEQIQEKSQISSNIFEIFDQQWIIFLFFSIFLILIIYFYQNRRKNSNSRLNSSSNEDQSLNQYDQMERIRQKQQKDYEEQALRYAEQKKAKIRNCETNKNENVKPLKYRRNDLNPLTEQSNSCSWRPSSRRKGAGG